MKRRVGRSYLVDGIEGPTPAKNGRTFKPSHAKSDQSDLSPGETEAGLEYLKSLFPVEVFEPRLPPIIMKNQVYSLVSNRTTADRELMSLCDCGRVRQFKLGESDDDFAVVFSDDYTAHVRLHLRDTPSLSQKFVSCVLASCRDVSVSRLQLGAELRVTEEEISTLVNHGVLLVRDVGKGASWWFAVPGISPFVKQYSKGKAMVQQMIRRSKYGEILQKDLQQRKLTVSKLGMEYHIRDIIGAELVECVETTCGTLLRLDRR